MKEKIKEFNLKNSVPASVQRISAWSLSFIIIISALWIFGIIISKFHAVVVPLLIAMLISAILRTPVLWLMKKGVPRFMAVLITLLATLLFFVGIMTFVVIEITNGSGDLYNQIQETITNIQDWLINGPLQLNPEQITDTTQQVKDYFSDHQELITEGALSVASVIQSFSTGLLLVIFSVIFILYDGHNIWTFIVKIFPIGNRNLIKKSGIAAFNSLAQYGRTSIIVAGVDAIGIGTGLFILGVPMASALSVLVFIGAFIPIVGALVTGFLAVFIALITKGVFVAVLVLVITITVMQIESHVLQPFLMGKSVNIHPLAIVVLIALGVAQAGIIGALLIIPITAFLNTFILFIIQNKDKKKIELTNESFESENLGSKQLLENTSKEKSTKKAKKDS